MSEKKITSKKHERFLREPAGYLITAVLLLAIGYVLGSLAVDSGSIPQWTGAIVAVLWGFSRLIQGLLRVFSHKVYGKRR